MDKAMMRILGATLIGVVFLIGFCYAAAKAPVFLVAACAIAGCGLYVAGCSK